MSADQVDLRELKRLVLGLYPPGHPLREALSRETDHVARDEALGKILTYLSLLR